MNKQDLLIIFVKNPVKGEVKTRLAKTVGDERALNVYIELLERTRDISFGLSCSKAVFYSKEVIDIDMFEPSEYLKYEQEGEDLGERMMTAFQFAFSRHYERVVLIGSDCYELSAVQVEEAFRSLENNDVVIGPATDGGYYLIGMKKLFPEVFTDQAWSTSDLLLDTILDLKKNERKYTLLTTLSDIDTEDDLKLFEKMLGHEDQRDHSNL